MTSKQKPLQHYLKRYLSHYAEPEAAYITAFIPNKQYQRCLVIPAYNETNDFVKRLQHSSLTQPKLLVILVINQPDNTQDITHNQKLWKQLVNDHQTQSSSDQHQWLSGTNQQADLLLINRFKHKIPAKQGVGLARKIGGDIACQLITKNCLLSHWVHHSDADSHLPENYFSAFDNAFAKNVIVDHTYQASAAIYPYQHISTENNALLKATICYEQALNYYVEGLSYAGSPYAFHTLGSSLVSNALHYCQVRGFPKRSAGEDFYLLNKLAKIGKIINIHHTSILIEARLSNRVPFGTGPAVKKILAMQNPETDFLYYHPKAFEALKALLVHFNTLFSNRQSSNNQQLLEKCSHKNYQEWLSQLSKPLQQALKQLNIAQLFQHIERQIKTQEHCIQHCHSWLDGFRTLKLIHLLEAYYPKVPLHDVINHFKIRNYH